MRVDENLHENGAKVATNSPDANIRSTPAMLRDRGIGALVVSTSTNPVSGILSERDIVRAVAARKSVFTKTVDTSMTSPVVGCAPEELLTDAVATMTIDAISPYAGGGGRQTRWHCEYWRPGQTSSRRAGTGCQ